MSYSRIQLLSNETINQIAAGEVVENPASVVKELVENAIDAGAKHVSIEISAGGLQEIRIIDDGCGMQKEDALLCLERHATSKIRRLEDLNHLETLGFRGEALPSIAAISHFSILTSAEDLKATDIAIAGGKILRVQPGARAKGTTIEVRDLFFNVPARKKFQKTPSICGTEIIRLVSQIALSYPEISFLLSQDGKMVLELEKTNYLGNRIRQVLGDDLFRLLLPIGGEYQGLKLNGFIGGPLDTRPNRLGQYLIMNGRIVHCFALSMAVREGYATRIAPNRYPLFVLHLELSGELIDVNVHPQKKEVRLREEGKLKHWVQDQVSLALQKSEAAALPFSHPIAKIKSEDIKIPFFSERTVLREEISSDKNFIEDFVFPLGVFKHFLLLNSGEEIILVDLRAAESRLTFDALLKETPGAKQGLMIPEVLLLIPSETATITMHLDLFEKMGFSIHASGKNSFLIDAIPSYFETAEISELFHRLVEHLAEGNSAEQNKEKIAAVASAFGKARKTSFMLEEGLAIWAKVKNSSSFCPRGQLIWKKWGEDEIKKWLKN